MRRLRNSGGRWWRRAAVAVLAVALVTAASAQPALADDKPVGPGDPPDAVMLAQQPLVAAAQAIAALDPGKTGLGGIRLEVDKGAVDVWWKGAVPDPVRQEIAAQEQAGVHIALAKARYSGAELSAAQDQIVQNRDSYPGLAYLAPLPNGSGLHGEFTNADAARGYKFPVAVEVTASAGNTFLSRAVDSVPWWGGAVIRSGGFACTSGFPVGNFFGPFELNRGLLTAAHCDPAGNGSPFTNAVGTPIGVGGTRGFPVDSTYIVSSSAPRVYTGGPGSSSSVVAGPVPNFPGQMVCTSGAFTFEHCTVMNLFVAGAALVTSPAGGLTLVVGVTYAINTTGGIAGGSGDSGGPVYVPVAPGHVLAAGMIDFGVGGSPCTSGSTALCSPVVGYVDINFIMATTLLMPLTSP